MSARWLVRPRSFAYAVGGALVSVSCTDGSNGLGIGACGSFRSELRIEDKFRQESARFIVGEPITFNVHLGGTGSFAIQ